MKRLILIFALAAMFAACNTQSPPVTPEQLPVNAETGIYGVASTSSVWPVWSVQVVWYRSGGIYGDHVGPFTVQVQFPNRPTKADVSKYVPQPKGLPGKWSVQEIYNVVQVGQNPIGQNPTK